MKKVNYFISTYDIIFLLIAWTSLFFNHVFIFKSNFILPQFINEKGGEILQLRLKDNNVTIRAGAGSKCREPGGSETLRYIIARVNNESIYFFITLGTLLKILGLYLLYFELWEPGAV